jgi:hypothetical protein
MTAIYDGLSSFIRYGNISIAEQLSAAQERGSLVVLAEVGEVLPMQ